MGINSKNINKALSFALLGAGITISGSAIASSETYVDVYTKGGGNQSLAVMDSTGQFLFEIDEMINEQFIVDTSAINADKFPLTLVAETDGKELRGVIVNKEDASSLVSHISSIALIKSDGNSNGFIESNELSVYESIQFSNQDLLAMIALRTSQSDSSIFSGGKTNGMDYAKYLVEFPIDKAMDLNVDNTTMRDSYENTISVSFLKSFVESRGISHGEFAPDYDSIVDAYVMSLPESERAAFTGGPISDNGVIYVDFYTNGSGNESLAIMNSSGNFQFEIDEMINERFEVNVTSFTEDDYPLTLVAEAGGHESRGVIESADSQDVIVSHISTVKFLKSDSNDNGFIDWFELIDYQNTYFSNRDMLIASILYATQVNESIIKEGFINEISFIDSLINTNIENNIDVDLSIYDIENSYYKSVSDMFLEEEFIKVGFSHGEQSISYSELIGGNLPGENEESGRQITEIFSRDVNVYQYIYAPDTDIENKINGEMHGYQVIDLDFDYNYLSYSHYFGSVSQSAVIEKGQFTEIDFITTIKFLHADENKDLIIDSYEKENYDNYIVEEIDLLIATEMEMISRGLKNVPLNFIDYKDYFSYLISNKSELNLNSSDEFQSLYDELVNDRYYYLIESSDEFEDFYAKTSISGVNDGYIIDGARLIDGTDISVNDGFIDYDKNMIGKEIIVDVRYIFNDYEYSKSAISYLVEDGIYISMINILAGERYIETNNWDESIYDVRKLFKVNNDETRNKDLLNLEYSMRDLPTSNTELDLGYFITGVKEFGWQESNIEHFAKNGKFIWLTNENKNWIKFRNSIREEIHQFDYKYGAWGLELSGYSYPDWLVKKGSFKFSDNNESDGNGSGSGSGDLIEENESGGYEDYENKKDVRVFGFSSSAQEKSLFEIGANNSIENIYIPFSYGVNDYKCMVFEESRMFPDGGVFCINEVQVAYFDNNSNGFISKEDLIKRYSELNNVTEEESKEIIETGDDLGQFKKLSKVTGQESQFVCIYIEGDCNKDTLPQEGDGPIVKEISIPIEGIREPVSEDEKRTPVSGLFSGVELKGIFNDELFEEQEDVINKFYKKFESEIYPIIAENELKLYEGSFVNFKIRNKSYEYVVDLNASNKFTISSDLNRNDALTIDERFEVLIDLLTKKILVGGENLRVRTGVTAVAGITFEFNGKVSSAFVAGGEFRFKGGIGEMSKINEVQTSFKPVLEFKGSIEAGASASIGVHIRKSNFNESYQGGAKSVNVIGARLKADLNGKYELKSDFIDLGSEFLKSDDEHNPYYKFLQKEYYLHSSTYGEIYYNIFEQENEVPGLKKEFSNSILSFDILNSVNVNIVGDYFIVDFSNLSLPEKSIIDKESLSFDIEIVKSSEVIFNKRFDHKDIDNDEIKISIHEVNGEIEGISFKVSPLVKNASKFSVSGRNFFYLNPITYNLVKLYDYLDPKVEFIDKALDKEIYFKVGNDKNELYQLGGSVDFYYSEENIPDIKVRNDNGLTEYGSRIEINPLMFDNYNGDFNDTNLYLVSYDPNRELEVHANATGVVFSNSIKNVAVVEREGVKSYEYDTKERDISSGVYQYVLTYRNRFNNMMYLSSTPFAVNRGTYSKIDCEIPYGTEIIGEVLVPTPYYGEGATITKHNMKIISPYDQEGVFEKELLISSAEINVTYLNYYEEKYVYNDTEGGSSEEVNVLFKDCSYKENLADKYLSRGFEKYYE